MITVWYVQYREFEDRGKYVDSGHPFATVEGARRKASAMKYETPETNWRVESREINPDRLSWFVQIESDGTWNTVSPEYRVRSAATRCLHSMQKVYPSMKAGLRVASCKPTIIGAES